MGIDTNFIEYRGINAPDCGFDDVLTFKEFSISEMLSLPFDACNISSILRTSVNVKILNKKIFKTPAVVSVEGQVLTGLKLGIEGEINTIVTYISSSDEQSVNVLNYKSKFYISTPIPNNIRTAQSLGINVYIESINIQKLDDKMLSENLVLLLTIE
ncbi:SPOCS domain-containing protein [Paraclostridium dentum]|uniref:SPOCS domain-containing protein n=1 Tax=Paraclostridium dentum TaxID=2662455 RepID=UPI003F3E6377